jgi:hypothetical protein
MIGDDLGGGIESRYLPHDDRARAVEIEIWRGSSRFGRKPLDNRPFDRSPSVWSNDVANACLELPALSFFASSS